MIVVHMVRAARAVRAAAPAGDLECVTDGRRAAVLLHPLRARLLALARTPASATALAASVGLPRQVVNYHVRQLARAHFLRRAGRRRKRNMIEQRYVATSRAYVFVPSLLRPMGADAGRVADAHAAERLIALAARMQHDLADIIGAASAAGTRVSTLSVASELRFESPAQRAAFAEALQHALVDVIARHSAPAADAAGAPAPGRPFRLVVGVYPVPAAADLTSSRRGAPHERT